MAEKQPQTSNLLWNNLWHTQQFILTTACNG
nr:MAG TPA: hypothetical protein [Caudoviricetes sp.]